MCRIIATTLAADHQTIVAEALESVGDYVDACLLIKTGSGDETIAVAESIVGEKLRVQKWDWCGDFSKARNRALHAATDLGFDWALTLDTDERMVFSIDARELRSRLQARPDIQAWLVREQKHGYTKERFFRLPTPLRWRGRTHEYVHGIASDRRALLPGVRFYELGKSPAQLSEKLERDLVILEAEVRRHPQQARWWYFFGQTHEQRGEWEAAIDAFEQNMQRSRWPEESAWSCFCAGRCYVRLQRFSLAIELCARGLRIQPASPELAWLAGWCSFRLGHVRDAITWQEMAVRLGSTEGNSPAEDRVNFRHLPAWYEAPFNVLRFAYKRSGRQKDAERADQRFHQAYEQRRQTHATPAE